MPAIERPEVTVIQALAKGDKLDLVVQKATELGAARIIPVTTARAVARLDAGAMRALSRRARWQKIAREASRQSGRLDVPEVEGVTGLYDGAGGIAEGRAQAALLGGRASRRRCASRARQTAAADRVRDRPRRRIYRRGSGGGARAGFVRWGSGRACCARKRRRWWSFRFWATPSEISANNMGPMAPALQQAVAPVRVRVAGFWRRLAAGIVDMMVLASVFGILATLVAVVLRHPLPRLGAARARLRRRHGGQRRRARRGGRWRCSPSSASCISSCSRRCAGRRRQAPHARQGDRRVRRAARR